MARRIDVKGLARTWQKPESNYFLQTETRTRLFNINPNQTRTPICDETKCKNLTKPQTQLPKPKPAPCPNPTV